MEMFKKQHGQVSILIAIIFQVLFIFFAMVINVGLFVHDKINLQNSVDIAAYYGAMKQAEVMNTMAHINFQIRQAWKLLVWRNWTIMNYSRHPDVYSNSGMTSDDRGYGFADGHPYPIICLANMVWEESTANRQSEDKCHNANLNPPSLDPIPPNPITDLVCGWCSTMQYNFGRNYQAQYNNDCAGYGANNFAMTFGILRSYKDNIIKRRKAIQKLQRHLIAHGPEDFLDIRGASVVETAEKVFRDNLTTANRDSGPQFEFGHSLSNQPFMVPIEVQLVMRYMNYGLVGSSGCGTNVNTHNQYLANNAGISPDDHMAYSALDVNPSAFQPASAQMFDSEGMNPINMMKSLVGFEKNPWVVGWVRVYAKTRPRMLFSPSSQGPIEIQAEAYAMPFGGRMGAWYYDKWPQGASSSMGNSKVDSLLPPRLDQPDYVITNVVPNYSRFPGDKWGMRSRLAGALGIFSSYRGAGQRAHFNNDDYGNVVGSSMDPLVFSSGGRGHLRDAEMAAIAPDLFDALNFSINPNFEADMNKKTRNILLQNICEGGCNDLGTGHGLGGAIAVQIAKRNQMAYWTLKDEQHTLTSWAQEATDRYVPQGNTSQYVGKRYGDNDLGGRSGYSVKIVSRKFLTKDMPNLGGAGQSGRIQNPPQ